MMHSPSSRFVILFTGRSGSSYLSSLLDSHPNVICEGEMLAEILRVGRPPERQLIWSRKLFQTKRPRKIVSVGFKTKLDDIYNTDGFRDLLDEFGVRLVHLIRQNLVKQVISALNAERLYETTGQWNVLNERGPIHQYAPLSVDADRFDRLLHYRVSGETRLAEFVSKMQRPMTHVIYEDLLISREQTLGALYDFLNVPHRSVTSRFEKHTPDNLREAIANFDELKRRYAGTDFEPMFDET